jgi:prepilin-type N-terminal cleavage/methylation domain-containing protein
MKKSRSNRAGFTLIEIMVVVAIMGLILTMGIPSIYQLAKKEGMRRAVSDLKDVLSNARAQAILSGGEVQVKFYPPENRFEVTGGGARPAADPLSGEQSPTPAPLPSPNQTTAATLPPDISFGMLQVDLLNYRESEWTRVRFFPNGTSDELRLVLVSERGDVRGIELEPTTGLARTVSDLQEIRTWE